MGTRIEVLNEGGCHIVSAQSVKWNKEKLGKTHIIMRKDKLSFNLLGSTTAIFEIPTVMVDRFSKLWPRHTADETASTPRLSLGSHLVMVGLDLAIQPVDHLFAAVNPVVPVSDDHGTPLSFILLQFDSFVQLPHPLGDLLHRLRIPQIFRSERTSFKVLLESAIFESAQHSRSNVLPAQTTKNLQFLFSINQMFHLRTIDA